MNTRIDEIDEQIVKCLRQNSRMTMKELGEKINLSGQAAKNRVEKLEDRGILQKYTINIDCPVFGYKIHALIRMQLTRSDLGKIKEFLKKTRQRLLQCYQITGDHCYIFDMVFLEMEDLQSFLEQIESFGHYEVNLVLKNMRELEE